MLSSFKIDFRGHNDVRDVNKTNNNYKCNSIGCNTTTTNRPAISHTLGITCEYIWYTLGCSLPFSHQVALHTIQTENNTNQTGMYYQERWHSTLRLLKKYSVGHHPGMTNNVPLIHSLCCQNNELLIIQPNPPHVIINKRWQVTSLLTRTDEVMWLLCRKYQHFFISGTELLLLIPFFKNTAVNKGF